MDKIIDLHIHTNKSDGILTPKEADDLIKRAGGKVVLAHLGAYNYENNLLEENIIDLIKEMNINAIEGYYLYVDRNNKIHNDIDKWNKFAKNNSLISTVGSGFHKDDGICSVIGFINTDFKLDNNTIKKF